jgi:hypothetical protein
MTLACACMQTHSVVATTCRFIPNQTSRLDFLKMALSLLIRSEYLYLYQTQALEMKTSLIQIQSRPSNVSCSKFSVDEDADTKSLVASPPLAGSMRPFDFDHQLFA